MRTLSVVRLALCIALAAHSGIAQAQRPAGLSRSARNFTVPMDTARAGLLYVGNKPSALPQGNFAALARAKLATDSIYTTRLNGIGDFQKVTYKSDGLAIPAYLAALPHVDPTRVGVMSWSHGA